jgi:hypothetical protein
MPLRCCIVCSAEASPDLQLQYCAACQSALYCSEACQRKDWRKQHKQICKLLNVGHGDMQVRTPKHTSLSIRFKEAFETEERSLDEDMKLFFKLFEESTFEGSRAAARKMSKIVKRKSPYKQNFLLFFSLRKLIHSDSEMLSWPNSPLLVILQFVDPNVLSGGEGARKRGTSPHILAELADPNDYSTHENQLILAKQLIERGANVNAVSSPQGITPLHSACSGGTVTNLDFVELLLEDGSDPNAQDHNEMAPLMYTTPYAPGAAKFLLNWPITDATITNRSGLGVSFSSLVRKAVRDFSDKVALSDNPARVQHRFLLQQWRDIEGIVLLKGVLMIPGSQRFCKTPPCAIHLVFLSGE